MRVRFLADSLTVGGAERVLQTLCTELPRLGIETGLSTLRDPGRVGEAIAAAGVPVDARVVSQAASPWSLPQLVAHLRHVEADFLYVLDHSNVLFLGRVAARLAGIPHQLCAIHRTRRADGSASLGFTDRLLMPLSDVVVAVSQGQAEYLHEVLDIPQTQLRVVYNGVAMEQTGKRLDSEARRGLRAELGLPLTAPLVVVVAALRPEKNHELLFTALAAMTHDVELVLVGGGEREEVLKAKAQELGLSSRIHWMGMREDVPRILEAVDLLALGSHPVVETFPLCVLEAMAAGLPVVSTRVGSLDEMVEDGVNGLLVPPGDAHRLATAMSALLADPARSELMGQAGRLRALRNFDRAFMVEETARLLRNLACR